MTPKQRRSSALHLLRIQLVSSIAICIFVVPLPAVATDRELETEVVIPFDSDAPGPYRHPSMFDELDNGDLYVVYYGGAGEYEGDTAVYGFRKPHGSDTWTKPQVIADTPGRSEGNAVIWQGPNGTVWLFYLTRYGETWSTSRIKYKISSDGGRTWTDSRLMSFEEGLMVRAHPIVLQDGDYLLPVYHETGHDTEFVGAGSKSLFFRFDPKTKEWTETNRCQLTPRQHSAGRRANRRGLPRRLFAARRRIWTDEGRVSGTLGIT